MFKGRCSRDKIMKQKQSLPSKTLLSHGGLGGGGKMYTCDKTKGVHKYPLVERRALGTQPLITIPFPHSLSYFVWHLVQAPVLHNLFLGGWR